MITLGKIRVIGQVVFGTLIIFFMVSWIATINVSVSDAGLGVNTIKKMDDHTVSAETR